MKYLRHEPAWIFCALLLIRSAQGQPQHCPGLEFEHEETLTYNDGLWNLEVGDLDGDGDLDAAVVGIYYGGVLSVFKNQGDGSFQPPAVHVIGDDPRCVVFDDLDGDLDLDLIVSNSLGRKLFTYFNDGTGNFTLPDAVYEFRSGVRPIYFVARDLDHDFDLDLVVSNPYGTIEFLWNRGDGYFDLGLAYEIDPELDLYLYEIVVEDLDGDGDYDLAVQQGNNWDFDRLCVLKSNEAGTFGDLRRYPAPRWSTGALAAADVDGDGDLDLAGVNSRNAQPDPNGMWIVLNDGAGHFGPPTAYPAGLFPVDVHFGDLDGDGDLDGVVPNGGFNVPLPHDVSILLNRGDGTFEDDRRQIAGDTPQAALPCDLDSDGDLDVLVANWGWWLPGSISALFNLRNPGDTDGDGDVGRFDQAMFQGCMTGVDWILTERSCEPADFRCDDHIDLADRAQLQTAFKGQ